MNDRLEYITPTFSISRFSKEDIIRTSGPTPCIAVCTADTTCPQNWEAQDQFDGCTIVT